MKRSKRYKALKEQVSKQVVYSLTEAVKQLKNSKTKFTESVEMHVRLGINPKKSDQIVRGSVHLPHGTGKTKRVIAFVSGNGEAAAKQAGADIIGTNEVITKIKQTSKIDFDVAVATPDMMRQLAPIARILGQKGLMPNPKTETVGQDVAKLIQAVKKGKVNFKNDDTGNVHLAIGKTSFSEQQLQDNITETLSALRKAKPASAKGVYFKSVTLCSTMGPGLRISVAM
ncbi:MAG: 50S ribosomal protein L1 [Patescibacteria group bacterium]|jgi:large subunit ribosomal protein L1